MTVGTLVSIIQFVLLIVSAVLSNWMYRKFSESRKNPEYSRVKLIAWLMGSILFGLWAVLTILSYCAAAMV